MQRHNINIPVPVVVPVNAKVKNLGVSFRSFAKKSAKCVLGMAATVVKAKSLSQDEFLNFCDLVGLDPSSSRIRKLTVIGINADKLRKHLASLPPNWTTIYEIAQMDDDLISRLVNGGALTPNSTAASIRSASTPRSKSLKRSTSGSDGSPPKGVGESFLEHQGQEVIAYFSKWLDPDQVQVLSDACDALRSIGAEIQLGEIIEDMIEDASPPEDSTTAEEIANAN